LTSFVAMALGLLVIYSCGTLWLAYFAGFGKAAIGLVPAVLAGVAPFVTADLVKLVAAAGIMPGLWRLLAPGSQDHRS
jgi:biotin transporter BioY